MMVKLLHSRKGFTLVELLVVIVVLAVLGAIVVPKFVGAGKTSKEAALRSDLQILRNAIQMFRSDTGYFPAALADVGVTSAPAAGLDTTGTSKTILATDWKGPYVVSVPNDPISAAAFTYVATTAGDDPVGTVRSSSAATSTEGTAYNTW